MSLVPVPAADADIWLSACVLPRAGAWREEWESDVSDRSDSGSDDSNSYFSLESSNAADPPDIARLQFPTATATTTATATEDDACTSACVRSLRRRLQSSLGVAVYFGPNAGAFETLAFHAHPTRAAGTTEAAMGAGGESWIHFYARLGLDVLWCNYRGYGASQGTPSPQALQRDGARLLRIVRKAIGSDRVMLVHGESMGGMTSVGATLLSSSERNNASSSSGSGALPDFLVRVKALGCSVAPIYLLYILHYPVPTHTYTSPSYFMRLISLIMRTILCNIRILSF